MTVRMKKLPAFGNLARGVHKTRMDVPQRLYQ
jgi:hypothetical protein